MAGIKGLRAFDPGWGVTVVRVMMAVILIVAGFYKVTGGFAAVTKSFAAMGIPAPAVMGPFIGLLELIGGALLLLGLATRWLGVLFVCEFLVTTFYVKLPTKGFGPAEIDLMMLAGSLLLVLAGPGRAALDELWLERPAGRTFERARAA